MSCGKVNCRNKAKENGVCGVHKRWAFTSSDPQFKKEVQVLKDYYQQYHQEAANLESQGIDILNIQGYWNNNLTITPTEVLPDRFLRLGSLMNLIVQEVKTLQTTYDPHLVYNVNVRINHQYSKTTCQCDYCQLIEPYNEA